MYYIANIMKLQKIKITANESLGSISLDDIVQSITLKIGILVTIF